MSIRTLAQSVLVAALLAGLARCCLVAFRPDTFVACWLGLGWLTWRWGDCGPDDQEANGPVEFLGAILAWPIMWVVALVLMVVCLVCELDGLGED